MEETGRAQALIFAQQPDHLSHQSGLAYLETLCGQPMCWVPPGSFLMGSDYEKDPQAKDREFPQHQVTLPGYWIGRYPVTVSQFRTFVDTSGYQPTDTGSLEGSDDHPVTVVTWHDALAFCDWLSERAGILVMLPSEAEWEKAARGKDGRIYPWGNELPDKRRCNAERSQGESTPVNVYSPHGDSPYGCSDMAGNVWEWTRSLLRKYPYNPQDGREARKTEFGSNSLRVLRGGSFLDDADQVRCACRSWYIASSRGRCGGFRIAASPE
ncbi:MAG: formylglycine-generating enzyme family protein [Chloroflexi bacterium]|nr:formylglycine-generating enzyme family protein [Chloroflexota bacterium]